MLKLSEEQCAGVEKMEDDDFVRDTAQRLKRKFPEINEPDETFHVRLRKALDYANTLPLKEKNVKRDFCFWRHFGPVFI
ncbi:hypothetical protein ACJ8CJ_11315 [Klebsiella pneumoniae]